MSYDKLAVICISEILGFVKQSTKNILTTEVVETDMPAYNVPGIIQIFKKKE
jgi:hypothetical protein